jgi:Na+-translocating ferredoxin:NAD+ oxidoreductase subunit B
MNDDIFEKLREKIDQYGLGFSATATGVEIKLLKRLFSEEDARLWMHLTDTLETPDVIAKRANQDLGQVAAGLQRLKEKGLTFIKRKGEKVYYAALPFAHGLYEHQLNKMDKELAQLFYDYFNSEMIQKGPPPVRELDPAMTHRTIPVNEPVNISQPVATYDDAREIIRSKDRIALADCVCAVVQERIGKSCNKPKEVCLHFGFYAENSVEMGIARWITQEEALEVLDTAEKAGLIHQSANMVNPESLCNCCADCCCELNLIRKFGAPAMIIPSNYFAHVSADLCNACEICIERCPMHAITISTADVAEINKDMCIGCGLCINSCPTEALKLFLKPEGAQQPPARNLLHKDSGEYEGIIQQ